jgi:hypothetical protein
MQTAVSRIHVLTAGASGDRRVLMAVVRHVRIVAGGRVDPGAGDNRRRPGYE